MLTTILLGAFLPAILTGGLILIFQVVKPGHEVLSRLAAPAIATGFTAGQFVIIGLPAFPPVDVTHWLPYIAFGGAVAAVTASLIRVTRISLFIQVATFALALRLILGSMVQYQWSPVEALVWILGLTAVLLPLWKMPAPGDDRLPGWFNPTVLLVAAIATSGALVFGRSALLGQLAGCLASTLGALAVLPFFIKDSLLDRPGLYVCVLLLASFWAGGYFYAELPVGPALLLWAALLPIPLCSRLLSRGWSSLRVALVGLALAVVVSGAGLFWGYTISEDNADMYDQYGATDDSQFGTGLTALFAKPGS